jgi:hypothetical protein
MVVQDRLSRVYGRYGGEHEFLWDSDFPGYKGLGYDHEIWDASKFSDSWLWAGWEAE